MLPPISYKVHPKMAEILEDKRRRREVLMQARDKEEAEKNELKQGRKQYFEDNRKQISRKLQQIHSQKIVKHNYIREEQKDRQIHIAIKRSQRLKQLIPQRRQLVDMLRNNYIQAIKTNDKVKKQKIQQMIEARIVQPQAEIMLSQKIREHSIMDTNEGICVICLTSQAHIYMVQCRHLIACKDCEFILRMQKKCPLCRKLSDFADLKDIKKKKHQSLKK